MWSVMMRSRMLPGLHAARASAAALITSLDTRARAPAFKGVSSPTAAPAAAVPARRQRRRLAPGGLRPIVTGAVKAAHCVAVSNAAARYVVRRGMVANAA